MKKLRSQWVTQHLKDPFVQEAQKLGLRSRAAFKLKQLQNQDHLFKPGITVIDLGAAPGSWCQVARQAVGPNGKVIAVDLLAMKAIPGVNFIQADFLEPATFQRIRNLLLEDEADIIISDLSPNLTGQRSVDQAKALRLWEAVLTFAQEVLKLRGTLVIKVFQGADGTQFQKTLLKYFDNVLMRKPQASRSESREVYLVAKDFRGGELE